MPMNVDEDLVLRTAHRSEASAMATLSRLHVEHGLNWRWTPNRIRQHIAAEDSVALVASVSGNLEGCAIMKYGDDTAHLYLLVVQPKARNNGIGRALLGWLEKSCRTAGIRNVRLEFRATNSAARCFYEALGYRSISRVPQYYDRRETAVVMVKSLD
jgi:ribosomal-protein-alanine N-acetyltransferase